MHLPDRLDSLAPKSAKFCLHIEKIFLKFFPTPEDMLFLASLSGGADSIALTLITNIIAKRLGFRLVAVHINHCLRLASAADAEFVHEFCALLAVPLQSLKINVAEEAANRHCGLEEAGREARYNLLIAQAKKLGAKKILLGHHAQDLAEDIIMRLVRGAGWPALGGMEQMRGLFFRPFLHVEAQTLRDFLLREQIPWREDESNQSDSFLRNRIRHHVIPLLKKENPSLERAASQTNKLASIDRTFWNELLDGFPMAEELSKDRPAILLDNQLLNNLQPALRLRIYLKAMQRLRERQPVARKSQARMETLLKLDGAFQENRKNLVFQLPGSITATLLTRGIRFSVANTHE